MQDSIRIPVAFCLRVDDVGWHNGADDRYSSRPSRTGIPRKHVPADYRALHELGKALNMKISCSLVLGEWDKDNVLRGGFGEACADYLINHGYDNDLLHIGVPDTFVTHGTPDQLYQMLGMDAESIAEKIIEKLQQEDGKADERKA